MYDVSLTGLRSLAALREFGTVAAAANALRITQPALTRRLQSLARQCGAAITKKHGRQISLTPAGLQLCELSARLDAELEAGMRQVESLGQKPTRIRLAADCYTTFLWLPRVMEEIVHSQSHLRYEIIPQAKSDPIRSLKSGEIDLALVTTPPSGKSLVCESAFVDEIFCYVAGSHSLAGETVLEPHHLAGVPLYLYDNDNLGLSHFLDPAKIKHGGITTVPLTEGILSLVETGAGATFLASWIVSGDPRAESLRRKRLGSRGLHRSWYLVYRQESATATFLEFARQFRTMAEAGANPSAA